MYQKNKIFIIGEIGCNHDGDFEKAKKMSDELINIGVDAIKFQIFKADKLISKFAPKAEYQKKVTSLEENQLDMTKKLELSYENYEEILKYIKTKDKNINVFATAFDLDSIGFLESLGQKIWKIPSGEITNYQYLERISRLNNKSEVIILMSTGMSNIDEIKRAIKLITSNGIKEEQIVIFHCNTEYPTPYIDVNLNVLNSFHHIFKNCKYGLSDHSLNIYAPIAAVPYGISYVEKHFTLDKNSKGPDHKASMNINEFRQLVEGLNAAYECLGNSEKRPTSSESKNIFIARRSIVAKKNIKKGEVFSLNNITVKRPGNGISAWFINDLLGKKSEFDFSEDELIRSSFFEWEEQKCLKK